MPKEFHAVYVYDLRGNAADIWGDLANSEGGKVFGSGSRAGVAVAAIGETSRSRHCWPATIHYYDIGDYLTREQKLDTVGKISIRRDRVDRKSMTE